MTKIRIRLRSLLVLVTILAVYLGAREWREKDVQKLCQTLEQDSRLDNYIYILPDDWIDKVWQRKPTMAKTYTSKDGGKYLTGLVYRLTRRDVYSVIKDKEVIALLKELDVVKYE